MLLKNIKKLIEIYLLPQKITLSEKPHIFIFLAADYGNVGDIAITCAQEQFLKKYFPQYEVIKIPLKKTYCYYNSLKQQIKKEDIITIVGGGNLGDLYYGFEMKRQFVIKKFLNNKIISFPQSIYFSNTKKGNIKLKKSQNIYSKHNDLTIIARDSLSYKTMTEIFNNKILFTPDIVLSYKNDIKEQRKMISICLRSDLEGNISRDKKSLIINEVNKKYQNVRNIDTHIGNIDVTNKEYEILNNKLKEFAESKVVITDRLHGMIFCAITATPCIVLANNNFKIEKTYYDWLQNIPWIKFFKEFNINEILLTIDFLESFNNVNPVFLEKEYLPIINKGSGIIEKNN